MSDYRVALISYEFPPFMLGGIASNCYDLACSLSKRKISTTVFCRGLKTIHVEEPNDYLKVVRLPFLNIRPRSFWFQLQNLTTLLESLRKNTVIHTVNPLLSLIGVYSKEKLRKPLVTSIHEVALSDLRAFINSPLSEWTIGDFSSTVLSYPFIEYFAKKSLKNADHIIVYGSSAFEEMKKKYRNLDFKKISVIYNAINFDKIDGIGNDLSQQNRPISITYYGRLCSIKGISYLLKAMAILKQDFPDLHLNIFGKGPLERKIRSLTLKLDLKDRVHIRGHFPNKELIMEIKRALIVVLPSLYEVGPFIAALEAMACKKPLVVFDLPFIREFISNLHTGILAKARDVKDLSEKIHLLLSDETLRRRISQNAYEYVKERHNWDILVEKYMEIYENCISC